MDMRQFRQEAAIAAMKAMLGDIEISKWVQTDPRYKLQADGSYNFREVIAVNAVEFADALLDALQKPRTK